ncbi:MAG TPA: hypothetical protein VGD74_02285, partial [Vulgatibacter sp.]
RDRSPLKARRLTRKRQTMGLVRRSAVRKVALPIGRPPTLEVLERETRAKVQAILERQAEVLGLEVETLIRRLGPGRLEVLLESVDWDKAWEADLRRELAGITRDALVRVAAPELSRLGLDPTASFRLLNPRAMEHARDYVPTLVREVTRTTQEAIRARIEGGFEGGRTVQQIARDVRGVVGLTQHQMRPVVALQAAGKDKAAEKLQARLIRQRAQTIANTETIRAFNEGMQTAWTVAAGEGLIDTDAARRFWSVAAPKSAGGRACEICTEIALLNKLGVGLEQPFELPDGTSILTPPAHPRCRCGVKMRFA